MRRRTRLSLLLPALALLLGALPPFAAAPAQAQSVLVSNFGQDDNGGFVSPSERKLSQGFTTGNSSTGYTLTSIQADMRSASNLTAANVATVRAELWSDSSGLPGSKVADLRVPTSIAAGSDSLTVTFPAGGIRLDPNTPYHFVWYATENLGNLSVRRSNSDAEDAGAASGWSIANAHAVYVDSGGGPAWGLTSGGTAFRIAVNGAVAPLAAPTGLTASVVGGTRLDLTWSAPTWSVSGYDVHYTSVSEATAGPDAGLATGANPGPGDGWVDAGHTGTAASHSIPGLTRGTTYRLRVRGVGAAGAGAWLHGEKDVPTAAPGPPTHLSVRGTNNTVWVGWRAPSYTGGLAVAYRTQYTSSTTVDDDAAVGSNPTNEWATGTACCEGTTWHRLAGLGNGTPYRVRVQAYNSAGASAWVFGRATTTATPGPTLTGLTLTAGSDALALTPTFGGTHLTYTATAPHDAAAVTVKPTWTAGNTRTVVSSQIADDGAVLTAAQTVSSSGGTADVTLASSGGTWVHVTTRSGNTRTDYLITLSRLPAPPGAVTGLRATGSHQRLALSWRASSGTVTSYDVHYTSAPKTGSGAVTDDEASTVANPANGWVDTGHGTTGLTRTISGLTNDREYRVRVRARNGAGAGAWETVTATPVRKLWALNPLNYTVEEGVLARIAIRLSQPAPAGGLTLNLKPLFGAEITDGENCATTNKASAADLGANVPTTVTIGPGSVRGEAQIPTVANDVPDESDECFAVQFSNSQAAADAGWIANPEPDPSYGDQSVAEITIFNVAPAPAPAGLAVTPGDGKLDLAWTDPGAGSRLFYYQVHYTSAPATGAGAVRNDAPASGSDAAAGWVSGGSPGRTATSHAITGLVNGLTYRVRLRGMRTSDTVGAWAFGTGTLADTEVPGAVTGLAVAACAPATPSAPGRSAPARWRTRRFPAR